MPEGDIVLRVARRLDQALAGQRLQRGELRWPGLGGYDLSGRVILEHATYGKNLLARLDDGRTLHTHLRMDGIWRIVATSTLGRGGRRGLDRSPRVRAVLGTGAWTALGVELGMMHLVATRHEHELIGHLGPDVLAPDFEAAIGADRLRSQGGRPLCEALLDQRVVAGFGTIYCAESLWQHQIWPWTACGDLDAATGTALLRTGRQLMWRSAMARTPTATGDEGRRSNVHSRRNRPCPRCGRLIERGLAQAGDPHAGVGEPGSGLGTRPIFWCPGCQRQD